MTKEIVEAVGVLEREKGISADRLMAALEDALLSAYKKTPEAAKYARVLNEFPRVPGRSGEKKLTTRALEELSGGNIDYQVVPRRRAGEP